MKLAIVAAILLTGCTHKQSKFLSPIHADIDAACRFNPETKAVKDDLDKLGPTLKPQIKTKEVESALRSLDKDGGETLYLLSQALGYETCDLIETLRVKEE